MCVCGCNGAGFVFVLSVYCDGIVFSFFLCSVTSIRVCSLLLFSAYVVKCVVFLSSMRKKSYLYLVFFDSIGTFARVCGILADGRGW